VKKLSSKAQKKFEEWSQKVRLLLKNKDESALNRLPMDCRWLQYWGRKLREQEPSDYLKVEKIEMDLLSESANALHSSYLSFLKKAQRHKKGTKIRLVEILRYAYYYGNYAHAFFIAGGKEEKAKKILSSFWRSYLDEIVEYKELLEDYQIMWILRLAKHSRDLGIKLEDRLFSKLEAEIKRPPDPILLKQCKNQLKKAEDRLNQNETITALILADQSLELFLKDLCIIFGCENDTRSDSGKPFVRWGVTEYLRFLDEIGEINENEKRNFFSFHEWRNCAQHKGLEPSARSIRMVIDEITKFIDEHLD